MFREERIQKILKEILDKKSVVSNELADEFQISLSTLYKDLNILEKRGYIRRAYGGAYLIKDNVFDSTVIEELPPDRRNYKVEKEAIGKATSNLISDGDTIAIDGGTTNLFVFKNSKYKKNLTIITNSSMILSELTSDLDVNIVFSGGILRKESLSFVGETAEYTIGSFRANKAIIGIEGVSLEHGLTSFNFHEATIKKKMIAISKELIVVADSSKIGKFSLIPIAPLEKMSYLVTDENAPNEILREISKRGVEVIVAPLKNQIDSMRAAYIIKSK
jgi:DeoR/GlpR family transcriptional regulator of sugar metabolism